MSKNVTIKIHPVNCGDCISIRYLDLEGKPYNIIIDAGYAGTYKKTLRKEVKGIVARGERINLFVLSHIHDDHISGMKSFLKEFGESDLVEKYWFNWVPEFLTEGAKLHEEGKVGIQKAQFIRDYLLRRKLIREEKIKSLDVFEDMGGARITILSPSEEQLETLKGEWAELEIEARKKKKKISGGDTDHHLSIDELNKQKFIQDGSHINASSISFLLELTNGFKALFLADAWPEELSRSIRHILKERGEEKLNVDFVKLSHHGSGGNTSPELISLIDCSDYAVSSNGNNKHNIPDKEALVRVIADTDNIDKEINLSFNYKDGLDTIFSEEEKAAFEFECHFNKRIFEY